jgi:uncharacterized membrane protein YjfL (UPF0719 family)
MDIQSLILWGISLIVTIVIGFFGVQMVKSRKSQNQKISENSVGIQSGKNTKIDNGR